MITFFSFFTILTNILTASVFTAVAFQPKDGWGKWLCGPSVQAAAAVYIAIVGMVYQLLLRQLWNPQGAQWVADVLLHSIVPVGYVVYWLLFAPRDGAELEGFRYLADLPWRLPGVHPGAWRGERVISLSLCGRERVGLRRSVLPGRDYCCWFSWEWACWSWPSGDECARGPEWYGLQSLRENSAQVLKGIGLQPVQLTTKT